MSFVQDVQKAYKEGRIRTSAIYRHYNRRLLYMGMITLTFPLVYEVLPIQDIFLRYTISFTIVSAMIAVQLTVLNHFREKEVRSRGWNSTIYLEDIFEYRNSLVNSDDTMWKNWYSRGLSKHVKGHDTILSMNADYWKKVDKLIDQIVKDVNADGSVFVDGVEIRSQAHKPLVCGYDEEYLEKAFKPSVEAESPGSQKEPPEMKRTSDTVI